MNRVLNTALAAATLTALFGAAQAEPHVKDFTEQAFVLGDLPAQVPPEGESVQIVRKNGVTLVRSLESGKQGVNYNLHRGFITGPEGKCFDSGWSPMGDQAVSNISYPAIAAGDAQMLFAAVSTNTDLQEKTEKGAKITLGNSIYYCGEARFMADRWINYRVFEQEAEQRYVEATYKDRDFIEAQMKKAITGTLTHQFLRQIAQEYTGRADGIYYTRMDAYPDFEAQKQARLQAVTPPPEPEKSPWERVRSLVFGN